MSLCQYKDILGEPGQGQHSIRLFNISVVDVVATAGLAWAISWYFQYAFVIVLLILFIAGIVAHRIFCVRTTVDQWLFSSEK